MSRSRMGVCGIPLRLIVACNMDCRIASMIGNRCIYINNLSVNFWFSVVAVIMCMWRVRLATCYSICIFFCRNKCVTCRTLCIISTIVIMVCVRFSGKLRINLGFCIISVIMRMICIKLTRIAELNTWETWYSGPLVNEKITKPLVSSTSSARQQKCELIRKN